MHEHLPTILSGASSYARGIELLFWALTVAGVLFTILSLSMVLMAPLRHALGRVRATHEARWTPAVWIVLTSLVVLAVFFWSVKLEAAHANTPKDSLEVLATGSQWQWSFQHEEGPKEIGELHVPLGVPVRLTLTSNDVLHRFSVPALRLTQDVLPGRLSQAWFRPDVTGSYQFQCTEYCGAEHSLMSGQIHVMSEIDYVRWVTGGTEDLTPEQAGRRLFAAFRCDSCHKSTNDGTGPSLEGRFGEEVELADGSTAIFDEAFARESLLEPSARLAKGYQPVMPPYRNQLDETQVIQLVAYLKVLSNGSGTGAQR